MKNILMATFFSALLISCGGNAEQQPASPEAAAPKEPAFVSPIRYSSSFEFGDPKKSEMIVQLWKDFDDNNLDANKSYFADSVSMEMEGMTMQVSLDTMLAMMKGYRSSLPSVKSDVDAVISVRSTDKMEDWVLIWGVEQVTGAAGKVDSSAIHELWRFDANGKVDYIGQYRRNLTPQR